MADSKHIVKRRGHTEPYDSRKLYASVYAACLAVRSTEGEAELVSARVVEDFEAWMGKKQEVTAADIRRVAGQHLAVYNDAASYIYTKHLEWYR